MTSSDSERRDHRRYPVDGVKGRILFATEARVLNMSLDGMSIETTNPLKVGREYSLKLEEGASDMPIQGHVVWCSLVKTARSEEGEIQPVYKAGIHFEDLLTSRAGDLRSFIRQNAVISLENRLFGRFRIEPVQSAEMSFEADFRVRQLSVSGMLVETDVAPPIDSRCRMDVGVGEFEFATLARIVRVERTERRGTTGGEPQGAQVFLGVEFLEMDDETRSDLADFITHEVA